MGRQTGVKDRLEIQQNTLKEQIEQMKGQIKKMILEAREKQNKKIQIMQKLAEKHSRETKSQSESIRIKIAAQTLESYGKGDAQLCAKPENLTRERMDSYCDAKFADDI